MKLFRSHPHHCTFFLLRLQCRRELSAAGLSCGHHAVHPGLLRLWRGLEHRYLYSPAPQNGAKHGRVPGWVTPHQTNQVAPHGNMFLAWKTGKLVSKDDLFSLVLSAIQALRSVLNAFCVVNRKNMFVYQERTTKSVFYLRWVRTSAFFILVIHQYELFSDWRWCLRSSVNKFKVVDLIPKECMNWWRVCLEPLWIKTISKCSNINVNVKVLIYTTV